MSNQTENNEVILGIDLDNDSYPWQVVGGAFDGTTMCNGSGGQGIGGIGQFCCQGGKQGDTNV